MAAEVNKPDFSYQWASGGAIVTPSDVKIQTGWTAEVPPFQWENYLQNRQDNAILHLFQKGISEWDALSNYYFTTSGVRSYVQGSNGHIYVAVQDSVGQNPVTDTSEVYWADIIKGGSAVFSTPGVASFTVPPVLRFGLKKATVVVIAGGGGGGKRSGVASTSAGGGGGGGGVSISSLDLTGVTSVSVTTGAAGAGATTANTAGSNGGSSSFGALLTATGGLGGGVTGGGDGGVGTLGNLLNSSQGPGTSGINYSNSATVDAGSSGSGGGAGGAGITFTSGSGSITGNAAKGPGGGGGGGVFTGNGGVGGAGLVYIIW